MLSSYKFHLLTSNTLSLASVSVQFRPGGRTLTRPGLGDIVVEPDKDQSQSWIDGTRLMNLGFYANSSNKQLK